jgi:hypothetical protein
LSGTSLKMTCSSPAVRARLLAKAITSGSRSMPTTDPDGPTNSAASIETSPAPQPRSSNPHPRTHLRIPEEAFGEWTQNGCLRHQPPNFLLRMPEEIFRRRHFVHDLAQCVCVAGTTVIGSIMGRWGQTEKSGRWNRVVLRRNLGDRLGGVVSLTRPFKGTDAHCAVDSLAQGPAMEDARRDPSSDQLNESEVIPTARACPRCRCR